MCDGEVALILLPFFASMVSFLRHVTGAPDQSDRGEAASNTTRDLWVSLPLVEILDLASVGTQH